MIIICSQLKLINNHHTLIVKVQSLLTSQLCPFLPRVSLVEGSPVDRVRLHR